MIVKSLAEIMLKFSVVPQLSSSSESSGNFLVLSQHVTMESNLRSARVESHQRYKDLAK
jgi:hypothetical protein